MSGRAVTPAGAAANPRPGVGAVVAALLLPPLAVFLVRGFGPSFWIGVALTVLFFVPGILFAFAALYRPTLLHGR